MTEKNEKSPSRDDLQGENTVFALDIGTRTVIGIVAGSEGDKLRIHAQSITEHESRAVFDGQIHDILKTAQAVNRVKSDLENKLGCRLKKVAIAAAGRSLKTRSAYYEQEIGQDIEIDPMICRGLEMDAVKEAHRLLLNETGETGDEEFYCVGYTVVSYYLDGYSITTLIGHNGKRIGVEVLATFLPKSVVNGLYAVLSRVSLESMSLTLEPIAASSAIIPETYRLLNLALLDIGAGTSDIAISRDGSIVAYGMVPLAGDEITEAIAQNCLADFNTSETIKRQLSAGGEITYQDVLGIENTIKSDQVLEMLDPVLEDISGRITAEILRLNGSKPPKSVFVVGGGGQVPTFTERIARKLDLTAARVGMRGRKAIPGLVSLDDEISGPEGVTVVGIARVALDSAGHNFITLNINHKDYRLFHSRQLTVFDALGLIGYNLSDLVGKNGKDLRFVLNGQRKVIYGGLCTQAGVFVNGEQANLKTELFDKDAVIIEKAVKGEDAQALVDDFVDRLTFSSILVDGCEEVLEPQCFINGIRVPLNRPVAEGDRLEINQVVDVRGLAGLKGIDIGSFEVYAGGVKVDPDFRISNGDSLKFRWKGKPSGDGAKLSGFFDKGQMETNTVDVSVNGDIVTLSDKNSYIFVDIFNHIDIDFSVTDSVTRLILKLNGKNARYTDPVKDGDVIEVYWDR